MLILAGTGMLSEVAEVLAREGWHVVLPSRRYSPIAVPETRPGVAALRALRPPGHVRQATGGSTDRQGRAIWVEASWDRPRELARKAEAALGGPADLLVAWVHDQYRRSVMGAIEKLLTEDAPVVEVRAVESGGLLVEPEPLLVTHPTQLVLLGTASENDPGRSLAHGEIAGGVMAAVRRAIEGHPTSLHQVGLTRPLVR